MPAEQDDPMRAIAPEAAPIFLRAAQADRRADRAVASAIDDFLLAADDRLDERTRASLSAMIHATCAAIERDLAGHAAKLIGGEGAGGVAGVARILDAGLLRDAELMGELIAQTRLHLLDAALAATRPPGPASDVVPRFAASDDPVLAAAAADYLRLEMRQQAADLPQPLHRRIVWWIAAALRERHHDGDGASAVDRALVDAAARSIAAHDEADRLEPAALRLAAAIDARPEELPALLHHLLGEARASLFVAIISYALRLEPGEARAMLLDRAGDRLWLALRALGCAREAIARIALTLADADPARDIEAFADALDTIAAIPVLAAREALAPLALPQDYRRAIRVLERTRRA